MQGTRVKGRAGNRSRHALLYSLLGAKEPMPKDGFIPTIFTSELTMQLLSATQTDAECAPIAPNDVPRVYGISAEHDKFEDIVSMPRLRPLYCQNACKA